MLSNKCESETGQPECESESGQPEDGAVTCEDRKNFSSA